MLKLRGRHGPNAVPYRISSAESKPAASAVYVLLILAVSGCQAHRGNSLTGRASDEWTRTYQLSPDGELQIIGANGSVDVQGTAAATIEVRAERVARAATDAAARDVLPRIEIREDVAPGRVVLQTQGLAGIVIGVDVAVNYHVTVPATAKVRVRVVNGDVTASDLEGQAVLSSTNGAIIGKNLRGGVDARSVNKGVMMGLGAFGRDPVDVRATNGAVELTVPPDIDASLEANFTNGTFDIRDLKFEPFGDQTRRRTRGRLNAGGTPITITTVNGNIRVRASGQ